MAGKVVKSNPEEMAVLQNVAALIEQLQGMEAAEINAAPEGEEGGELDPTRLSGARMAMKGSEQGRTPAEAQSATDPGAAPKDKGMAPWDDEEVKKALKKIAKAIGTSDSDGPTANDDGEERVEDIPDPDEENVQAVAKALAKIMGGKKTVAKSQSSTQNADMLRVMKGLVDRVEQQGTIINELLEGLGIAKSAAPAPEMQVQKSQSNRPYAGLDGGSMEQVIGLVAKSMLAAQTMQAPQSGIPMAQGFTPSVNKDMGDFVQSFAQISQDRWGTVGKDDQ